MVAMIGALSGIAARNPAIAHEVGAMQAVLQNVSNIRAPIPAAPNADEEEGQYF